MNRTIIILATLLLAPLAALHAAESVDVCVYGATPAGIVAAVAAAREGASVVVIEPTKWIGGMVAGGLARTDFGRQETIGGLTREFFSRSAVRSDKKFMWYAEPHANMETFEAMLREAKVIVVRGQRLKAVARDGNRITSLTTEDGTSYAGKMFVDATYEGDLMAQSGVSYVVGRESRDTYGEPLAGFYPMPVRPCTDEVMSSVCACLGGRGPHYAHGTPAAIPARNDQGRLLFGVTGTNAVPGSADKLTQSYNFRLTVTRRLDLRVPFPKPVRYDTARYELLLRLIQRYPRVRFGRLVHLGKIANDKFDLNAQGLFSTDYVGGNAAYPDGDYATRDRIWQDHVDYVQGFLWFLGHDERVPKTLRDEVNEWGLCRDEFTDNEHWSYALYVREARRMIGEYVMVQKDCRTEITKPDSVAMGSFTIDCHIVQLIVAADGTVADEGSFPNAPAKPYQIAYRSVTPREAECANLLVPVCLSASHVAYCSLRMEPVYMALGQASGVAAVMALRGGWAVQEVDVPALQAKLRDQKQVLALRPPPRNH
ncbi:MAG: FAD-dependent oxidoreductase [Kiritimatiellaeota bacterium]|nr:FAD-dependent oxidoreductase [Kiritimatiellota bacterium]